jgi:hypothetical protein
MTPLKRQTKGKSPSFLDVEEANKVVDNLNAISRAKVVPAGTGTVLIGDDGMTIDLSALLARITALETAIRGMSATGYCNGDGSVTTIFSIPL